MKLYSNNTIKKYLVENNNILLSVIIPTYKPKDYLFHCLKSISEQTLGYDKFEVLIILNGCNEPWYNQVNVWLRQTVITDNCILIQTDSGGVSNARNIGIDNARGKYIAFIDDDDYISPSYFEGLLRCSSKICVGLSDCAYFIDGNNNLDFNNIHHKLYLRNLKNKKISLLGTRSYFNGPCMKIIHRDIIGTRRFDTRFKNGEDSLFMILISDRIKNIQLASDDVVYYRRIRLNSATTSYRSFNRRVVNMIRMFVQITLYWMRCPFKYNMLFLLSRYIACFKGLLENPVGNSRQR